MIDNSSSVDSSTKFFFSGAEGEKYKGIVLFPKAMDRRIEIAFTDDKARRASGLTLRDTAKTSRWSVNGITIGSSLADVQKASRGQPLLTRVMMGGRREVAPPSLGELRTRCRAAVADLPASLHRLHDPVRYPVRLGNALQSTIERLSRTAG